jgi:Putative zinc- or iron-chelating domain
VTAELATLCQSCALCCDGSLFGRVDLEPDEVDSARRNRLPIVPSGKAFEQPCAALVTGAGGSGLRCAIYDERPRSCRRFVCKLYDRHVREGGPIEARIAVVRRVRALVAALEGAGFEPADFEGMNSGEQLADPRAAAAMTTYLELMRTLEADFSRVR